MNHRYYLIGVTLTVLLLTLIVLGVPNRSEYEKAFEREITSEQALTYGFGVGNAGNVTTSPIKTDTELATYVDKFSLNKAIGSGLVNFEFYNRFNFFESSLSILKRWSNRCKDPIKSACTSRMRRAVGNAAKPHYRRVSVKLAPADVVWISSSIGKSSDKIDIRVVSTDNRVRYRKRFSFKVLGSSLVVDPRLSPIPLDPDQSGGYVQSDTNVPLAAAALQQPQCKICTVLFIIPGYPHDLPKKDAFTNLVTNGVSKDTLTYYTTYHVGEDLSGMAELLAQSLTKSIKENPNCRVVIVAHSFGALMTRLMLNRANNGKLKAQLPVGSICSVITHDPPVSGWGDSREGLFDGLAGLFGVLDVLDLKNLFFPAAADLLKGAPILDEAYKATYPKGIRDIFLPRMHDGVPAPFTRPGKDLIPPAEDHSFYSKLQRDKNREFKDKFLKIINDEIENCGSIPCTPTPTPTNTATNTPTSTPITPTITFTPTPTNTPTATPTYTATPTLSPTITLTVTPTPTVSTTPTIEITTGISTATPTHTPTSTTSPVGTTETPSPLSPTPTPSVTNTATGTPTVRPSVEPSNSPSFSF